MNQAIVTALVDNLIRLLPYLINPFLIEPFKKAAKSFIAFVRGRGKGHAPGVYLSLCQLLSQRPTVRNLWEKCFQARPESQGFP